MPLSIETLRAGLDHRIQSLDIPGLATTYCGKVRDVIDLGNGQQLMITTDRQSAFDRAFDPVPFKGQIVNQLTAFMLSATRDIAPNHMEAVIDPNVMVSKKLEMLPVEVVVRGYMTGTTKTSLLTMYNEGKRTMYGHTFADGIIPHSRLETPIITPTTKSDKDEPLSEAEVISRGLVTPDMWEHVRGLALGLYARGSQMAGERGLILADTKFEFGIDENGIVCLADEALTPESSRYWETSDYETARTEGRMPQGLDKDFLRNWVKEHYPQDYDNKDADIVIPDDILIAFTMKYIELFERMTGNNFIPADLSTPTEERILQNINTYLHDSN